MTFRIASVAFFMFHRLLSFGWHRLIRTRDLDRKLERDYLNWAAYTLALFDVDLRVEGREHVPRDLSRPLVVMSNHQSQLDIPALVAALGTSLGFVAKKELARIPLLSYWMRQLGCVVIDRSDRAGAHRALEKAAREMGRHPLVVFPEGTRSKTGRIQPFKTGGFRLAVLAQARILPVLIENTRDAGENRSRGPAAKGGRISARVKFFPCIETQGLPDGKASLQRLKEYVEECLGAQAVPRE